VGQLGAVDPATARVATGHRREMEPRGPADDSDALESTAASSTGDGCGSAVSNGFETKVAI
jgi:hypothetical protein